MLVNKLNFDIALSRLNQAVRENPFLGFDTETTCLPWWENPFYSAQGVYPRVFSMQFSTKLDDFYFDFNELSDKHFVAIHNELTQNPDITWFIANAKFDLHHSKNHDVEFAGTIHCTKAIARVMDNNEPHLDLDTLGEKYLNVGKIDVITKIKEQGFVTQIKKYGRNDKFEEVLHFDKLPLAELVAYGQKDTRLVYDLGQFQIKRIKEIDLSLFSDKNVKLSNVMENERKLTKVLYKMERVGVKIDRKFTEEAYNHEVNTYLAMEEKLNSMAGKQVDWNSAKQLKPIFEAMNEPFSYTEKGNASFDKQALEESESELAKTILKYRYHYKRAHTYFENFIWLADKHDILHADTQQGGTGFGRMSYWTPNLQNVPKRSDKEETAYKVRRCFIPRPGKVFVDIDYKGAEFVLTMDYAKEMKVIEQLKAGLDPHADLGQNMNLTRDNAKTMTFRILYGGGQEAVGKALGYKGYEAKRIGKIKKNEYFAKMPNVSSWIKTVTGVAKYRGYIFNWLGRVLGYGLDTAYKASNGLIQGGVGDTTKVAMVDIDFSLCSDKNHMLLQIHDAILFELAESDVTTIVPTLQLLMERAYPHKLIQLKTDVGYSKISWADLKSTLE